MGRPTPFWERPTFSSPSASSPDHILDGFRTAWLQVFGYPLVLELDRDGGFEGELKEHFESAGTHVAYVPAEAHWRIGAVRGVAEKLIDQNGATSGDAIDYILVTSVQAVNSAIGTKGRSPYQAVFGKVPRWPGDVLGDDRALVVGQPHLTTEELRCQAMRALIESKASTTIRKDRTVGRSGQSNPARIYGSILAVVSQGQCGRSLRARHPQPSAEHFFERPRRRSKRPKQSCQDLWQHTGGGLARPMGENVEDMSLDVFFITMKTRSQRGFTPGQRWSRWHTSNFEVPVDWRSGLHLETTSACFVTEQFDFDKVFGKMSGDLPNEDEPMEPQVELGSEAFSEPQAGLVPLLAPPLPGAPDPQALPAPNQAVQPEEPQEPPARPDSPLYQQNIQNITQNFAPLRGSRSRSAPYFTTATPTVPHTPPPNVPAQLQTPTLHTPPAPTSLTTTQAVRQDPYLPAINDDDDDLMGQQPSNSSVGDMSVHTPHGGAAQSISGSGNGIPSAEPTGSNPTASAGHSALTSSSLGHYSLIASWDRDQLTFLETPEDGWDGSPPTMSPTPLRAFRCAAADAGEDVDTTDSSDSGGEQTASSRLKNLTRQERKAMDREIPWRVIMQGSRERLNQYVEANKKEFASWQSWGTTRPLTEDECRKVVTDPVTKKRIIPARNAYRDKLRGAGPGIKPKCQTAVLGCLDPDLHKLDRSAPTPTKLSEMLVIQTAVSGMNQATQLDKRTWHLWSGDVSAALLQGVPE